MLDRKRERWTENFTYFFGGLTEEEQMYRDYFLTDLEQDPEDAYVEDYFDEKEIAESGQFNPKIYDFVETGLINEVHETFEDIITDKIFKYKYRQYADAPEVYARRMNRVIGRFVDRAKTRDPALEADLFDVYMRDDKDASVAQVALDASKFKPTAVIETSPMREYMVKEGTQQFRDYYESDAEVIKSFEYLDNLSNRDRIRFMEVFDDFSVAKHDTKEYAMIEKREFNPELSAFSNVVLDLVDFRDRVRPLARDLTLMDAARKYQKINVDEIAKQRKELLAEIGEVDAAERGYSSGELGEGSSTRRK